MRKSTTFLCAAVILTYMVISGIGLWDDRVFDTPSIVSVFGEEISLHGRGLYAHDSQFKAPIFMGTDVTIVFLIGPLSLLVLLLESRGQSKGLKYAVTSIMSFFIYQGLSISLGAMMNSLFLVYILLVSANLISLMKCVAELWPDVNKPEILQTLSFKGIIWLLGFNALALLAAWLPDLIIWTLTGEPYRSLEMYTTGITKVLDLGLIVPLIIYSMILLGRKSPLGLMIFNIIIGIGIIIGFVVVGQTVYQLSEGIELGMGEIVVKGLLFSLLSLFGIIFQRKVAKAIDRH